MCDAIAEHEATCEHSEEGDGHAVSSLRCDGGRDLEEEQAAGASCFALFFDRCKGHRGQSGEQQWTGQSVHAAAVQVEREREREIDLGFSSRALNCCAKEK